MDAYTQKTRLTRENKIDLLKVGAAVPFSPPTYYPSFSELILCICKVERDG